MRTLRWTTFLLVLLATVVPASAHAKTRTVRCAVPHGWHVVSRNPRAVLIQGSVIVKNAYGPGWDGRERRWRYCAIRSAWSWSPLVTEAGQPGGDVDFVSVGNVALSGIYAEYDTVDELGGGRYGTQVGLTVTNVLTGTSENANMVGDGFAKVLMAPPFAAWLSFIGVPGTTPLYWAVQTFDGRTGKTALVDSTCPSYPNGQCDPSDASDQSPFSSLQLLGCLDGCSAGASTAVAWSRDGVWRFAPIG